MSVKEQIAEKVNIVAEIHFSIYPQLKSTLRKTYIADAGMKMTSGASTYFEWWTNRFGDKFFEMATFVRLGSVAEAAFRDYYMDRKRIDNLVDLKADPAYTPGVFQRVISGSSTLQALYNVHLGIDIKSFSEFSSVREFFVHRHLYAHNSGLLDEKYLADLDAVGGQPKPSAETLANLGHPAQDAYWFEPLSNLNKYIEDFRRLFRQLP
ncbi:MAG: hypothetical protein JXA30_07670 [Deltaproteobacteria bacterium]|nr:hypothetical protein [Deltaproteobacteria bacterium]